jgi:hypothetical protein
MKTFRIETIIEADGELHLTQLPFRKGDRVEVVVVARPEIGDEQTREEARKQFLALARESRFCSTGPYQRRDELHDRR